MGVTSIRLNPENEAPLEDLAQKLDRSKNYIINQALKEFIARQVMEDSRWADTLQAVNSVKAGKSIDEETVSDWLKSWGSSSEKEPPTL